MYIKVVCKIRVMDNKLKEYLDKNSVNYVLHRHSAVFTVAESSGNEEINKIPGLRCKTLFLKDESGIFYLVGMPGAKRLDIKKLEKHLSVKKLRFASEEELEREIKLKAGSVSIFGAINSSSVMLIIDKDVWSAITVCFHPNINTETLEIKHENLERYYRSLVNRKEIIEL